MKKEVKVEQNFYKKKKIKFSASVSSVKQFDDLMIKAHKVIKYISVN